MKFIDDRTIKLDKVINELDRFVLDFVRTLEKHVGYVIVSGYVSILFGRARATEDIDVLIEKMPKEKFGVLYEDLKREGYWCLNSEDSEEIYNYLNNGLAVRFALKGESIPNFEVKFARTKLAVEALKDALTAITSSGKINISSLERQIAFKRYYLKSDKDLEDARHLEEVFKGHIDKEKINKYKELIGKNEKAQAGKKQ